MAGCGWLVECKVTEARLDQISGASCLMGLASTLCVATECSIFACVGGGGDEDRDVLAKLCVPRLWIPRCPANEEEEGGVALTAVVRAVSVEG